MSAPVDCFIVGLGIKSYLQVTKEVEQALSLCNDIFFLHGDPSVKTYLSSLAARVNSLQDCYEEGEPRARAYEEMFRRVTEAATLDPPVGVALYGNPAVLVNLTWAVDEWSVKSGRRIEIIPGVSALDCILVELGVDPSEGLLSLEANDLLLRHRPLLPEIHLLVWQIGSVESELYATSPSRPERFHRIVQYLLESYPSDHDAVVVTCGSTPVVESSVLRVPLEGLPTLHERLDYSATLYLPPVREGKSLDDDYLKLLQSRSHLRNCCVSGL